MYFSEFSGLDFFRAHSGMASLPVSNGHDPGSTPLGLSLANRDLRQPLLSPSKKSPPHRLPSPRPGSTATTPTSLPSQGLSSALSAMDLMQIHKTVGLKPPVFSSPPPMTSNPEHNICKLTDYRGAQVAAFTVENRDLICLPQAFELFLKHLVGGLHTVYTKLKRLDITPVVCNVEQVRILRGLGAIQPGVNRCKLISCTEFDMLYEDCTNSNARPGRPAKRVHSVDPVTTDIMEKLKHRKLDIGGDYQYSQRLYDRQSMTSGFPAVGYPVLPQFSNFISMHHLLPHLRVQPPLGHRLERADPKPDRTMLVSGVASPRPRDERLPIIGMHGAPLSPTITTLHCLDVRESNNLLIPEMNSRHKNEELDESGSDNDCDADEERVSENDERDEDIDASYGSEDSSATDIPREPRSASDIGPFSDTSDERESSDFDSLVAKFNMVVRALVEAAKTVERRAGEEKSQMSYELVREKERCMELEKEMQEERRKREFFQKRARRLRKALRSDSMVEPGPLTERTERPSPVATSDADSLNSPDPSSADRSAPRKDMFESLINSHRPTTYQRPHAFQFLKARSTDI